VVTGGLLKLLTPREDLGLPAFYGKGKPEGIEILRIN